MNTFPYSNKDVDREILSKMSDKEVLKNCNLNKYFRDNVCNEEFFYNILLKRYPETLYFREAHPDLSLGNKEVGISKTYKQLYLETVWYASKLEELEIPRETKVPMLDFFLFMLKSISKYKGFAFYQLLSDKTEMSKIYIPKENELFVVRDILNYMEDPKFASLLKIFLYDAIKRNNMKTISYLKHFLVSDRDLYETSIVRALHGSKKEIIDYLLSLEPGVIRKYDDQFLLNYNTYPRVLGNIFYYYQGEERLQILDAIMEERLIQSRVTSNLFMNYSVPYEIIEYLYNRGADISPALRRALREKDLPLYGKLVKLRLKRRKNDVVKSRKEKK